MEIKRLGDWEIDNSKKWEVASGKWFAILLVLTAYLLLSTAYSYAQDDVSDNEVNDVAKELFCPVCESTPLDVCPTQACIDWREEIRAKIGEGMSKQAIIDQFATQYGDRVLAMPPRRGTGWLAWIMPFVGVAIGGLLFFRYMKNIDKRDIVVAAPAPPQSNPTIPENDYIARVEAELNQRK